MPTFPLQLHFLPNVFKCVFPQRRVRIKATLIKNTRTRQATDFDVLPSDFFWFPNLPILLHLVLIFVLGIWTKRIFILYPPPIQFFLPTCFC